MDLWPYKDTVSFFMKSANFKMFYTGLRYYVGFSQIRSQLYKSPSLKDLFFKSFISCI